MNHGRPSPLAPPPLRGFPATTGQSASAPRLGTQSLTGSARSGRSLSPPHQGQPYRGTPSYVPCKSRRPGSRRLHAGHHLANKRTPARLIPKSFAHPGSDVTSRSLTTLQQRFAHARLPDPHLTPYQTPFPPRSPRRSSANAAGGGLKPPSAGRLRRAKILHLSHSTTINSSDLHATTFRVRTHNQTAILSRRRGMARRPRQRART